MGVEEEQDQSPVSSAGTGQTTETIAPSSVEVNEETVVKIDDESIDVKGSSKTELGSEDGAVEGTTSSPTPANQGAPASEDTSPELAPEASTNVESPEPISKDTPVSMTETAPEPPPKPTPPPRRRPKPPAKGILKPPPPPVKPTLGNRLRDMVVGVTGEVAGPSSVHSSNAVNAAVGTFNAISGRFGLFNRFAPREEPAAPGQRSVPPRNAGGENGTAPAPVAPPMSDRIRRPLKRATFVLPSISITYPISSQNEPWSAKVMEDREQIESRQRMLLTTASGGEYWTSIRLIKLYESACRGREEKPRLGIVRALQSLPPPPKPRVVHLVLHDPPSHSSYPSPYPLEHPLTRYAAEALADLLTVEWSLTDLRLERGVIETEDALKPILHALLISGTLPSLSLAGNRRIRASGWRLVSLFLNRARSLRFLDVTDTTWDRKSIDYLVQALNSTGQTPGVSRPASEDGSEEGVNGDFASSYSGFLPPAPQLKDSEADLPPAVETLRMDSCGLRSTTLEALAHGVRTSDLKHISLRNNRIGQLGAVSLAVMIRDYPETTSAVRSLAPLAAASESYAPYTPRARRQPPVNAAGDDSNLPPIPLVSSSGAGGVTSRVVPEGYQPPPPPKYPLIMPGGGYSAMQDNAGFQSNTDGKNSNDSYTSLALQRSVRALDRVQRIGHLLTLDLKGNDIGKGVTYIAQVLKRNRTLKVLNLSENKIDAGGLVSLAEALKYNSTLETLDLSSNPCCGPTLDGISTLRMSFTVNNSLKRLFLVDTGLTTEGAIDLAEFIPENRSLLHLDVTNNPSIGTAGILALASGLKSNRYIRCLDVSIPPNDPNLADLSQSILQSCIRNTEFAATSVKEGKPARAVTEAIWRPIKKSALVRQVKAADAARAQKEREQVVRSVQGVAREFVYQLQPDALLPAAEDTAKGLEAWYAAAQTARTRPNNAWDGIHMPKDDFRSLVERARALTERIAETVEGTTDTQLLERLLSINDVLTSHVNESHGFKPPPRVLLPSQIAFATPAAPVVTTSQPADLTPRRRHLKSTSLEILSPNFSIGDSDAESDAEELDSSTLATPPGPRVGHEPRTPEKRTFPKIITTTASGSDSPRSNDAAAERMVEAELAQGLDLASSPVERASRKWVEEEGEIFRKGTRLGVVDDSDEESNHSDMKRDLTGEQLRQEIMETEVPRSPPRTVLEVESDEEVEQEQEQPKD